MKKILFAITIMFMMVLHSYAQKVNNPDGIKKNDLPVIFMPENLSVHFISPEPIQYVDISSKALVGDLPLKNVLRIKYKTDSLNKPGKDAVVTIAGEKFIAQYHVVYSPPNGGAIQTEIPINPADTRPLDLGIECSEPELKKMAGRLAEKVPEKHLQRSKAYGLSAKLNQVYVFGDYLFLDISYENKTKLKYEIDEMRFKIDDEKVTKATTVQSIEVKPELMLFDSTGFKRHYRNVFVFRKFTFPGDKVLQIEMTEKQLSGRVITLKIPYRDLLNADTIPDTSE